MNLLYRPHQFGADLSVRRGDAGADGLAIGGSLARRPGAAAVGVSSARCREDATIEERVALPARGAVSLPHQSAVLCARAEQSEPSISVGEIGAQVPGRTHDRRASAGRPPHRHAGNVGMWRNDACASGGHVLPAVPRSHLQLQGSAGVPRSASPQSKRHRGRDDHNSPARRRMFHEPTIGVMSSERSTAPYRPFRSAGPRGSHTALPLHGERNRVAARQSPARRR